jgi:hypothetical protein
MIVFNIVGISFLSFGFDPLWGNLWAQEQLTSIVEKQPIIIKTADETFNNFSQTVLNQNYKKRYLALLMARALF